MSSNISFLRRFSDEELDQAESLIKRERPDLWRNLTCPSVSQKANYSFYKDFFHIVRNFDFVSALTDVPALCYGLYNRSGRK